ncbi:hypothetical protein BH10BAC1_BH10BAC1_21530 [soil metagenome]
MRTKKYFSIILFLFFVQISKATTWQTTSSGFWNNSSIWLTGVVPPLFSSDTFNITFPVALQNNLSLNTGGLMTIFSSGGICGHYKMTLSTGSELNKFGILELDSLYVPGGSANLQAPGQVILSYNGIITSGGSLSVSGCPFAVGPWFNCQQPEYGFANDIDELTKILSIFVYPNPFINSAIISYDLTENLSIEISLLNVLGKEISLLKSNQTAGKHELAINSSDLGLAKGMYFVKLKTDSSQKTIKVIIK